MESQVMKEVGLILNKLGESNGLEMALDENGACTLELSGGRILLIQERAGLDELDFVATLGPVPEEKRAAVFTELLAANFYWNETFGATISWNLDLEEAVIMYPLDLAAATPEYVETIFSRFLELQSSWADRLTELVGGAQDDGDEDGENDENDADGEDPNLIIKV